MTLAEAKRQCRIEHNDDDSYLGHLIEVARDYVEKYCGTLFAACYVALTATNWADLAVLPIKVGALVSVSYTDVTGDLQALADVELRGCKIVHVAVWPDKQPGSQITVAATVGGVCPAAVKHAMLLLISDMNERREPEPSIERTTFDNLLTNYRFYD